MELLHKDLTGQILKHALRLYNAIGSGFRESVYEGGLEAELIDAGLVVTRQVPIPLFHRGRDIGDFFADLVASGKVIVELKAADSLASWHPAQLLNYLRVSGIEVGLLVNFGPTRVTWERRVREQRRTEGTVA